MLLTSGNNSKFYKSKIHGFFMNVLDYIVSALIGLKIASALPALSDGLARIIPFDNISSYEITSEMAQKQYGILVESGIVPIINYGDR